MCLIRKKGLQLLDLFVYNAGQDKNIGTVFLPILL